MYSVQTSLKPNKCSVQPALTYILFKVLQAELSGSEEEFCPVHVAGVQNDVRALRYPVTLNDIIRQGPTHGEVHHRVEAQAFVDEGLQHAQLLKVRVLQRPVTYDQDSTLNESLESDSNVSRWRSWSPPLADLWLLLVCLPLLQAGVSDVCVGVLV